MERNELLSLISDAHKDIFGHRPDMENLDCVSTSGLRYRYDHLCRYAANRKDSPERVRECNARALARRQFDWQFNAIGNLL